MKTEKTETQKAFQFFRARPVACGLYRAPYGMAPAALALKTARAAIEALPGLEAAYAAALAAMEGPPDVTEEAARVATLEAAYAAALAKEEAAGQAEGLRNESGAVADLTLWGVYCEALRERRAALFALEDPRRDLARVKSGEKRKANLKRAKEALQSGKRWQYSAPVWAKGYCGTWQKEAGEFYCEKPDSVFRNVEKASEIGGVYSRLNIPKGYYCDPYQDETCAAYVVQLRGRNGLSYFAPAYRFSHGDGEGLTVDLGNLFESDPRDDQENLTARQDAARAADSLAEHNAEKEREYQTASQAGFQWAEKKEEESEWRKEALAILAERKAARGLDPKGFPALCAALRDKVQDLLDQIRESREARAELAAGDYGELIFYPDETLKAAFCYGAGLKAYPA